MDIIISIHYEKSKLSVGHLCHGRVEFRTCGSQRDWGPCFPGHLWRREKKGLHRQPAASGPK